MVFSRHLLGWTREGPDRVLSVFPYLQTAEVSGPGWRCAPCCLTPANLRTSRRNGCFGGRSWMCSSNCENHVRMSTVRYTDMWWYALFSESNALIIDYWIQEESADQRNFPALRLFYKAIFKLCSVLMREKGSTLRGCVLLQEEEMWLSAEQSQHQKHQELIL